MSPYLGNESLDSHSTQELVRQTKLCPHHIAKLHWRHIQDNPECTPYLDLFDKKILLLRKNLFESSLSLAISLKKNRWGSFGRQIPDNIISIDPEFFDTTIRNQWTNIRNYKRKKLELGITDPIIWLEDMDSDETLWKTVTGKPLPTHEISPFRRETFASDKSPSKKKTVENYDELYDWYLNATNTLGSIYGLEVHGELIHEI